jgi:alkylhydroperoxidase family enzyme
VDRRRLADELRRGDASALGPRESAITKYVEALTRAPANIGEDDVNELRDAALSDREILDVVQAATYVAYVNRFALGLGVELESGPGALGQTPHE